MFFSFNVKKRGWPLKEGTKKGLKCFMNISLLSNSLQYVIAAFLHIITHAIYKSTRVLGN